MNAKGDKRKRLRNSLDIETEQLDFLRTGFRSEECALIPENDETESILGFVLDETGWEDHSSKDVPPPDFVNHEQRVMLEAMRVDDHERPGDKKGFVYPSRVHESEILKQYERNLKRGSWQSENVIFDSRRMKKIPDNAIEREVRKRAFAIARINRLRYIDKHG